MRTNFKGGKMYQKIKEMLVGFFERIRCFIDNESYQYTVILRGKSESDLFSDKIVREIDKVMNREKFSYQSGKLLLPTKYNVFVSEEKDSEWVGRKRQGLEKKIIDSIGKHLRPIASQATLMPHNYDVKIEVDRNLQDDEIKVVHYWEERESPVEVHVNGNLYFEEETMNFNDFSWTTMKETSLTENEEITIFSSRQKRALNIEIWQNGVCVNVVPFDCSKLTIGRGSPQVSVNIQLKESEISRCHLILSRMDDRTFNLEVKGRKPVTVSGKTLYKGQQTSVFIDDNIKVGSYSLCLRN
jgi:hypothetical protein